VADLRAVIAALAGYSRAGIQALLRRAGIRRCRGRQWVHSPDPDYPRKVARIARVRALAGRHPTRVAMYYGDEMSLYRQPTLAQTWAVRGTEPCARLSHHANHVRRYQGALDPLTGRVVWRDSRRAGVREVCAFLEQLRHASGHRHVFLVWDNWPVHRHPRVLAAAHRQRIHLVWLPTYAPWTNPIEKLWRWVRQTLVHHHDWADLFDLLQQHVRDFLDQFTDGSTALLRYVGLLPNMSGVTSG
jgi:transposase